MKVGLVIAAEVSPEITSAFLASETSAQESEHRYELLVLVAGKLKFLVTAEDESPLANVMSETEMADAQSSTSEFSSARLITMVNVFVESLAPKKTFLEIVAVSVPV